MTISNHCCCPYTKGQYEFTTRFDCPKAFKISNPKGCGLNVTIVSVSRTALFQNPFCEKVNWNVIVIGMKSFDFT